MSIHHISRNRLAIPAYTFLPRAAVETIIPRPRYKYFLSAPNITRPHMSTLFAGNVLDFDLILLYASMFLLISLLIWLIALTVLRIYWYIYDRYHNRWRQSSRSERFGIWRDRWNEGNDYWVRRPKSREESKIERARSKVGPQNVGRWNRWLDKESDKAASAAHHAIDKVGERTNRATDKIGERTMLLSKQRDGAGESEASGHNVVHLLVLRKDCMGVCWTEPRKRSAAQNV